MRWLALAREEVRDTRRKRLFATFLVVFVLLGAIAGYFYGRQTAASGDEPGLVVGILLLFGFILPFVAVAASHESVVAKRSSGYLKLLLGLAYSRRDVVLAATVGRVASFAMAFAGGLVTAPLVAMALGAPVALGRYAVVGLLLVCYGVTFVAVGAGVSAAAGSTSTASVGSFGVVLVFLFDLWGRIPDGVRYVLNGFSRPSRPAEWADAVRALNPLAAFGNAVGGLYPELGPTLFVGTPPADPPVYETPWFGVLVLAGWSVVVVALGYFRFRSVDL